MASKRYLIFTRLVPLIVLIAGCVLLWPADSKIQKDVFVPLDMSRLPAGLSFTRTSVNRLEIRIQGSKHAVESLMNSKPKCSPDLSSVRVGLNTLTIQPDDLALPEGISILHIHPSSITLMLDKEVTRQTPVEIRTTGTPAAGFELVDTLPTPSVVSLRGPEKIMKSIDRIRTEAINIANSSETFKKEIALDIPERVTIDSSKIIHADINLREKIGIKQFSDIRIIGRHSRHPFRIAPARLTLQIKGPENSLEHIDMEKDIQVYVELNSLKPGVYVKPASIVLPADTTLVSVSPEIFTITLTDSTAN